MRMIEITLYRLNGSWFTWQTPTEIVATARVTSLLIRFPGARVDEVSNDRVLKLSVHEPDPTESSLSAVAAYA